ncbi:PIN domain-containing protein [Lysobacter sp. KIS68-7]|uniref:PIN domain-containing protein n=1 Tax=Lysobacter sp. KIS68-7 TaxID=2904252 RepID=UPI001E4FF973|nr:PIN domain-containing protein [Lysobacter sp. KIS68-7]UHQ20686.1 PIN domain-containing protein [Lysobacter sp. KIS68-7]
MPRQYLLVDFENVQPASLGALKPGEWEVRVFHGQHQTKVDVVLARELQPFGVHGDYIPIVGNGKDALDFHIAYYIGKFSTEHPDARFVIVSRDTGFDPLIKHLETKGIACKRVTTIPAKATKAAAKATKPAVKAPAKRAAKKVATPPRFQEVVERLEKMKKARPGTVKTLRSSLASFKQPFAEGEIDAMLEALQRAGTLKVEGKKITYAA